MTTTDRLAMIEESLALKEALLDEWVEVGGQIAALEARRAELLARRLDLLANETSLEPGSDDMAFRSMCAEYAAAGHLAPSTAGAHITKAWVLARTLPQTLAALAAGSISKRHSDVIVENAPSVMGRADADVLLAQYEQQVIPFAQNDTAARTRTHAQGVTATICPESIKERHRRARSERRVTVTSIGDGMAELYAVLPELLAHAIHDRLTATAKNIVASRPEGQRRPRRSALEKIRAEREAALARRTPSDPEPPHALEDEFAAQFDERPPWESAPVSSDPQRVHPDPGPAHPNPQPAHPCTQHAHRDAATAPGPYGAGTAQHDADDDPTASIQPHDLLDDAVAGEAFHSSTPMHDGYGELEIDTRSLDQLRADVLADLLLTTDPTATAGTAFESIRATVQVTISASTLAGIDDAMAEFDGHGAMTPDAVRLLAGRAGSWDRVFLDPKGMVVQTDNYVPTAGMKRFLRARDQHCRFPGCRTPVHRCQNDHNHDHAKGGPTSLNNLSLFCASHHPLKHPDVDDQHRWTAEQLEGGTILWTSPLGRSYTDEAPLRVMFT